MTHVSQSRKYVFAGIFIFGLLVAPVQGFAATPPTLIWSQPYSPAAGLGYARGITSNAAGTSIVATGDTRIGDAFAEWTWTTIKYNSSDGSPASGWPMFFTPGTTRGYRVELDGSGDVYTSGFGWEFIGSRILKYASTGGPHIWTGTSTNSRAAYAMAYSASKGAVYTFGTDEIFDWITNSYNATTGARNWQGYTQELTDGWYSWPPSFDMAVDTTATAYIYEVGGYPMRLIKRTNSGTGASSVLYRKPAFTGNASEPIAPAYGMVLDSSNTYLYVVAKGQTTGSHYLFKILASNGTVVSGWPVLTTTKAYDVTLSTDGTKAYVAGFSGTLGSLGAYRTDNGSKEWDITTGTTGALYGVASDSSDNVYVAGYTPISTVNKFTVSKYGAPPNTAPVASAGTAHPLVVNTAHTHSGASATDVDGNLASYAWAFTACPSMCPTLTANTGSIAGASASVGGPTYTPNASGNYTLQLTVTDSQSATHQSSIVENVTNANAAPVATAGTAHDLTVDTAHTHSGASATDTDGNLASYAWAFTACPATCPTLTANTGSIAGASASVGGPTYTPTSPGSYTLQLTVTDNLSVTGQSTVTEVVPPVPVVTLTADSETVPVDGSTMLAWTTTNATSCNFVGTPANGISTNGLPNSSVSTGPLTSSQSYQISCTGPGGSVSSNIVNVTVANPTADILADPMRVPKGGSSTITWTVSDVNSCTISGPNLTGSPIIVNPAVSGSAVATPINTQSTYTIVCDSIPPVKRTVNVVPGYQDF